MTRTLLRRALSPLVFAAACDGSPAPAPRLDDAGAEVSAQDAAPPALTEDAGRPGAPDAAPPAAHDAGEPLPPPFAGQWLKGDLHVHSDHSTDAADSPLATIFAKAEAEGFDYLAITDHDNHVEGAITTWDDPAYTSTSFALLYGVEWTSGKGHANIFSTAPWDHPSVYALRDGPGDASIAKAHELGLHFSVNHPAAKDLWELGFELPYDSMEVWTAVFTVPNSNDKAIAQWDTLLAAGRRLSARGGSDSHHQRDAESLLFNIGNPTTWVRAREKSAASVIEALGAGRVSLSYAPGGERLDLTADADGDGTFETQIGDNLPAFDRPMRFRVHIDGFREGARYEVKVVKNAQTFMTFDATAADTEFEDTPILRSYYRVELRGDTPKAPIISGVAFGGFVALTNPIYVAFD